MPLPPTTSASTPSTTTGASTSTRTSRCSGVSTRCWTCPYFAGAETAGTIEAAVLGAEKGCDWIKQCLDYYEGRSFIREDGSYDIRMLPEIMQEQIPKLKPIMKVREVSSP